MPAELAFSAPNTGLESEPTLIALAAHKSCNGSRLERFRAAANAVTRYRIDEVADLARQHGASQRLLDAIASLKRGIA